MNLKNTCSVAEEWGGKWEGSKIYAVRSSSKTITKLKRKNNCRNNMQTVAHASDEN